MSMDLCELTGLMKIGCAHCRPKPEPTTGSGRYVVTPGKRAPSRRPITAQYSGQCANCGSHFSDGETIAPLVEDDHRIGWLGPCCDNLWGS